MGMVDLCLQVLVMATIYMQLWNTEHSTTNAFCGGLDRERKIAQPFEVHCFMRIDPFAAFRIESVSLLNI